VLKTYAEKRNFENTPEPGPDPEQARSDRAELSFVVQKHAASHLHYDFRLELNGTLISWAVPKGPSLNPHERRLAVKVEDHPIAYQTFEGIIPQREYGGGEVIVWDRGAYESQKSANGKKERERILTEELEGGKLEFVLHGHKLKGAWILLHTRENQWLLMKREDEYASNEDVLANDKSVISGRRIGGVVDASRVTHDQATDERASQVQNYRPMLLTEVDKPFDDPNWSFELKLDGIRAIVAIRSGAATISTRNEKEVSDRFPVLKEQFLALNLDSAVLDGEIVQFDADGHPDFQALVQPFQAGRVTRAIYCVFDVLELHGEDLRARPQSERRKILESLNLDQPNVRRLDAFLRDGTLLFDQSVKMGFEGIVGKRLKSPYRSGTRSKDWVKIKPYHTDEFVVVGFTKGEGARSTTFGALLLAAAGAQGLEYVGNVGGGFSDPELVEFSARLKQIKTPKSPLQSPPNLGAVTWVQPKMVVEVRFMAKTKAGRLRFPIFLRMRPDKELPIQSLERSEEKPAMPDMKDPYLDATEQLVRAANETELSVGADRIHFSHLEKELWPGFTKRDLAVYYASMGEVLLRYLKNRPLSFVRCPDGVEGERFFQKHWDKGRPNFVETVSIHSDANEGPRDFVMCNNLSSLLWLSQMGAVELNPWNSRVVSDDNEASHGIDFATSRESLESSILNCPDYLVLDLDPYFGGKATGWNPPDWLRLVEVAMVLKESLERIDLTCFPKSSGKSGLHLYVPIAQNYPYDEVRAAARTLGETAIGRLGQKVTLEWNIKKRPNGVFIDVNQNVRGKTMAAPYSPRAAKFPGVSMPLLWDELERIEPTQWTIQTVPHRLAEKGDLWAATLGLRQNLTA
jgi:bifunctional non-homologous end joining protein LigD